VQDRDQRRSGHLRLEPEGQIRGYDDHEDDQSLHGFARDLRSPLRTDVGHVDVVRLDVGHTGQFPQRSPLDVRRKVLGLHEESVATNLLDGLALDARRVQSFTNRRHVQAVVAALELERRPAAELEARVHTPNRKGAEADEDDDRGQDEPGSFATDEVEGEPAAAEPAHHGPAILASGAASRIPTLRSPASRRLRARSATAGCA
jgi:hypothetical protein